MADAIQQFRAAAEEAGTYLFEEVAPVADLHEWPTYVNEVMDQVQEGASSLPPLTIQISSPRIKLDMQRQEIEFRGQVGVGRASRDFTMSARFSYRQASNYWAATLVDEAGQLLAKAHCFAEERGVDANQFACSWGFVDVWFKVNGNVQKLVQFSLKTPVQKPVAKEEEVFEEGVLTEDEIESEPFESADDHEPHHHPKDFPKIPKDDFVGEAPTDDEFRLLGEIKQESGRPSSGPSSPAQAPSPAPTPPKAPATAPAPAASAQGSRETPATGDTKKESKDKAKDSTKQEMKKKAPGTPKPSPPKGKADAKPEAKSEFVRPQLPDKIKLSGEWQNLDFTGGAWARGQHTRGSMWKEPTFLEQGGRQSGYKVAQDIFDRGLHYGSGLMLSFLRRLGGAFQEGYPNKYFMVRTISKKGGGRVCGSYKSKGKTVTKCHGSHQNGLDADILYLFDDPEKNGRQTALNGNSFRSGFDPERHWRFYTEMMQSKQVVFIFVSAPIKVKFCKWAKANNRNSDADKEVLRRLWKWDGHDKHFHVRLRCPSTYVGCPQTADPPNKTGCY